MYVSTVPRHIMEMAVEPKLAANHPKMMKALRELNKRDPLFHADTDEEFGQTIIKGMGELHLDAKLDILRHEYRIDVDIGAPQVSYRETITRRAEADYTYKKRTGGTGQFARVKVIVEPGKRDSGLVFESRITGGAVPEKYLPGVERGLQSVMKSGNIIGFPMVDVKVTLLDGAFHEADSSAATFEIASRAAVSEAITRADPVLLEPVMKVEVVTPGDYLGSVISDLNSRRGQIAGTTTREAAGASAQVVNALVPLATMFGYANDLKTISQGRADHTMLFDHFGEVPRTPDSTDPDTPLPGAMAMRA